MVDVNQVLKLFLKKCKKKHDGRVGSGGCEPRLEVIVKKMQNSGGPVWGKELSRLMSIEKRSYCENENKSQLGSGRGGGSSGGWV